jgi:hypothetical protein
LGRAEEQGRLCPLVAPRASPPPDRADHGSPRAQCARPTTRTQASRGRTLIKTFGAESDDWLDKEIEIYIGSTEYEGEEVATLLVRVLSAEIETKKAVTPQ